MTFTLKPATFSHTQVEFEEVWYEELRFQTTEDIEVFYCPLEGHTDVYQSFSGCDGHVLFHQFDGTQHIKFIPDSNMETYIFLESFYDELDDGSIYLEQVTLYFER